MTDDRRSRLLVSACLVGLRTRFDGGSRARRQVLGLADEYLLVPVCPEQLGGLSTPRDPAEIQGGAGEEALAGAAAVRTPGGIDVTAQFVAGADAVAEIAHLVGAAGAVLKARSPSCGVGETYDGTFSGSLRVGDGVTAARLRRAGIAVWTEEAVAAGRGPQGGGAATGQAAVAAGAPPDRSEAE